MNTLSPDLVTWWIGFLLATLFIPGVVVAYFLFPARTRLAQMEKVSERAKNIMSEHYQDALRQYKESTERIINDRYTFGNYWFPLFFLTLVLGVGFFLLFSSAYPLYKFQTLNELLLAIPNAVFYGFLGGTFFVLFSVINRYRSADIYPQLVLGLGYQILFSGAVAYFAVNLSPDIVDPLLAFGVGFIPYKELTDWVRQKTQTKLGVDGSQGSLAEIVGSDNLSALQGMHQAHRERLGEEKLLTVQNLAFMNPFSLFLSTSYDMPLLIDWIDQAYLRLYLNEAQIKSLAPIGIRCAIELSQVSQLEANHKKAVLKAIAEALGKSEEAAQNLVEQAASDPQVEILNLFWQELGGEGLKVAASISTWVERHGDQDGDEIDILVQPPRAVR